MTEFLKIFITGAWSKGFWVSRWETFLELIRKPSDFYSGVGKKEWDKDAYLMGLSFSFVTVILVAITTSFFFGFITGWALVAFLIALFYGIVEWLVGAFILYYLVAWLFGFAAKLITKKDNIDQIRPILFTIAPTSLAVVIPGMGGIITLITSIVLLVIAYERVLKTQRGEAVASSILGYVFSGIALWIPFLLLGTVIASLSSGFTGAIYGFFQPSSGYASQTKKVSLPDSWGIFESFHHRTEPEKQAVAVKIIEKELEEGIRINASGDWSGAVDMAKVTRAQLDKLYDQALPPKDAYRMAIGNLVNEETELKEKYASFVGTPQYDALIDRFYDQGSGTATITVPSIESRHQKEAEASKRNESPSAQWKQVQDMMKTFQTKGQDR